MSDSPAPPPSPTQAPPGTRAYAPPPDDPWTLRLHELFAHAIVDVLPRGVPPERHRQNVRRWLDVLESGHRELGLLPPAWLGRARELHLGPGEAE